MYLLRLKNSTDLYYTSHECQINSDRDPIEFQLTLRKRSIAQRFKDYDSAQEVADDIRTVSDITLIPEKWYP